MSEQRQRQQGFKVPVIRVPRSRSRWRSSALDAGTGDGVPLTNVNEYSYLINVSVGAQSFPLILDTGSSDLWIVSNECKTSDCANVARYNRAFSNNLSLSKSPFHISYLQGSVDGVVASEAVSLGPYHISSQAFGLVNVSKDMELSSDGVSGVVGLAFPSEISFPGTTLLQNIFNALTEPYFAFKLGVRPGPKDPSSSFTFGQLDPTYARDISNFFVIPVSKAGADDYTFWKIPLLYLTINSTVFSLSPSSNQGAQGHQIAVLDTGTTMVLGPSRDVQVFWQSLGSLARKDPILGMWQIKCDVPVIVGFVFGDNDNEREFLLDPADTNWAEGGSSTGWCIGGIQSSDDINTGDWLLGDVFLRNTYTLHHGANSTNTPWIGLISTTNITATLDAFRHNRGPDLDTSPQVQVHTGFLSPVPFSAPALYTLSSLCGFVAGVVLMTLYRFLFRTRAWHRLMAILKLRTRHRR